MSSYSSPSLSGSSRYARTDSSSPYPSSPSTSPGTTPPSPFSLKPSLSPISPSFPGAYRTRAPAQGERAQPERRGEAGVGIDPSTLVGKTLTCVRRSRAHPSITLHFADGASFQVRVVGYDPHFRGIPKQLESDSPVLNPASGAVDVRLTVKHAAMITLADKAFQVQGGAGVAGAEAGKVKGARESRWTQKHAAFAVKFVEEAGWHCIWATLAEYDDEDRDTCVFRNFVDVYVDALHPPSAVLAHAARAKPRNRSTAPRSRNASPAPVQSQASQAQKDQKPKRKNWKKKVDTPKARW